MALPRRRHPAADAAIRTGEAEVPPWMRVMRAITGLTETPGDADNPKILAMRDEIKRIWADVPGLPAYADSYQHDSTAWCGLAAAFCLSEAGYMPAYKPPPADDTERFYWAQATASDDNFIELDAPRVGAIVVLTREGGGHITFYEYTKDGQYWCRGGNQSDCVNVAPQNPSNVIGFFWPKDAPLPPAPPVPAEDRPTLEEGDDGPDVVFLQQSLGIVPEDGDFGPTTEGGVKGFQRASGLSADGVVGPMSWTCIYDLNDRKAAGEARLAPELVDEICSIAENSAIAGYSWRDRGRAPLGYIQGVACCFAYAQLLLADGENNAVERMARADTHNPDKDALSWYRDKFMALGMDNSQDGLDTLRHLFVMFLGLGMRESSGRYCEGRDMSADNVQSDTAEAGSHQTSWNIRSCDSAIPPMLPEFWDNPNGFLDVFQDGVTPDSNDLDNFGSGDGAKYQFLSKFAPAFHAYVTLVGMRSLRQHWGPINRNEVELRSEADDMLWQVQELVASGEIPQPEPPEPEPPPVGDEPRVDIVSQGTVTIRVTGDVIVTLNGEVYEP